MPQLGDIQKSTKYVKSRKIWASCKYCKKERWVQIVGGKPRWASCRSCGPKFTDNKPTGVSHYNWKGGITKHGGGYLMQLVDGDSPYWDMVKTRSKQVFQHRLVMAEHLGRCLGTKEIVHHLNGIRDDNRIENLALVTLKDHDHNTLNAVLQARIRELEKELVILISKGNI